MIKKFINENIDLFWNYISVAVLGISGFMMNFLIILFYDEVILGIFNQSYAWYVIFSQIASLGIHSAVLKYSSSNLEGDSKSCFTSALIIGFVISFFITIVGELFFYYAPILESAKICLCYCLGGIPFFVINKIFLCYLNGLSRLKEYAIFQSVRYILIVVVIGAIGCSGFSGNSLGFVFVIEELILFTLFILIYRERIDTPSFQWIKKHVVFGLRVLPSNMTAEITPKADILCLSIMNVDDGMIGIYSLVSACSEGYYNLYLVLRRKIDPIISLLYETSNHINFKKINDIIKNYIRFILPLSGTIIVVTYYIFFTVINKRIYLDGLPELLVLYIAIMLNGYGISYSNMLAQMGFPGRESLINVITLIFNIILNIFLIPFWGILGAAFATAMSYFVFSILLMIMVKKII